MITLDDLRNILMGDASDETKESWDKIKSLIVSLESERTRGVEYATIGIKIVPDFYSVHLFEGRR